MALEYPGSPAERIPWRKEEAARNMNSYVLFYNTTKRKLALYWLDEIENTRFHTTLKPGERVKTNTYTNHSWIFCDISSNELMCVRNLNRFWPMGYRILDPNNPLGMIYCRKEIIIHYPLRSLRENCLCRIVNTLNPFNPLEAVSVIENLPIPHVLQCELKKRLRIPLGTEYPNEDWATKFNCKYYIPKGADRSFLK